MASTKRMPIKYPYDKRSNKIRYGSSDESSDYYNNFVVSNSWNGNSNLPKKYLKKRVNKNSYDHSINNNFDLPKFKPYDPINNCKSAGIIPYTFHNGQLYFLFQRINNPIRKKDGGWNDFGGKRNIINMDKRSGSKTNSLGESDIKFCETTVETAAREFCEETSCLFYIKELLDKNMSEPDFDKYYDLLCDNPDLEYDDSTISFLCKLIPNAQKYYIERINEFALPIYASSKEIYITYFLKVNYIPDEKLPSAEDIHIPYETRYIRTCKWLSYDDVLDLNEKDFHKRLQITKIQNRIRNYFEKGLLV